MRRLKLDKIASATGPADLKEEVYVSSDIVSREGYVVAVRVLGDKPVYNTLENAQGRMTRLKSGDLLAGVLGHRRALHGYAGDVPQALEVGERLEVLNLGGVLGRCTSFNPDVGQPLETELLGSVLHFPHLGKRIGEAAHISLGAIPEERPETSFPPLVAVLGTCMNSGKTVAACEVIHGMRKLGLQVAGAKVTGVSLRRDTLNMSDYGALEALSFTDAGIVSTDPESAPSGARRLLSHLSRRNLDVIVVEFGDGVFGEYGVRSVLADPKIRRALGAVLLCANDPAGAWGAVSMLSSEMGIGVSVVTGPVTDNEVGAAFIRDQLKLPAANALRDPESLTRYVRRGLRADG